jgi:hypothetical protein
MRSPCILTCCLRLPFGALLCSPALAADPSAISSAVTVTLITSTHSSRTVAHARTVTIWSWEKSTNSERWLETGLSSYLQSFDACVIQDEAVNMLQITSPRVVNMGFVVGTGHWGRFLFEQFVFLLSLIIPAMFHTHLWSIVGSTLPFLEPQYHGIYSHTIIRAM